MLAGELTAIRKRAGLSQEQLASFLGMSRSSIWRYESGIDPIPRTVELLVVPLGPQNSSLMEWVAVQPPKERILMLRRQYRNAPSPAEKEENVDAE